MSIAWLHVKDLRQDRQRHFRARRHLQKLGLPLRRDVQPVVEEPFRCRHDRRDRQDRFRPRRPAAAFQLGRQVGRVISMRLILFCALLFGSLLLLHRPAFRAGSGLSGARRPGAARRASAEKRLAAGPSRQRPEVRRARCRLSRRQYQGDAHWIAHRLIDPMGGQGWGWVKKKRRRLEFREMDRAAGNARARRGAASQTGQARHGPELGIQILGPICFLQGLRSAPRRAIARLRSPRLSR